MHQYGALTLKWDEANKEKLDESFTKNNCPNRHSVVGHRYRVFR